MALYVKINDAELKDVKFGEMVQFFTREFFLVFVQSGSPTTSHVVLSALQTSIAWASANGIKINQDMIDNIDDAVDDVHIALVDEMISGGSRGLKSVMHSRLSMHISNMSDD